MCELERRAFFERRYRAADDLPRRLRQYAVIDANQVASVCVARRSEFPRLRYESRKVRVDDQRAPRPRKHVAHGIQAQIASHGSASNLMGVAAHHDPYHEAIGIQGFELLDALRWNIRCVIEARDAMLRRRRVDFKCGEILFTREQSGGLIDEFS